MLLEICGLEKSFGDRKLISIKRFALYAGDKVAVAGRNGAGKTTLLKMVAGELEPDAGRISVCGPMGAIPQPGQPGLTDTDTCSGGEKTQALIAQAMAGPPDLLLADEPTTNLDIAGIVRLEELLLGFHGGLLLISHDRLLLENVCNKVLEVQDGKCTLYGCGYKDYLAQKALEAQTQQDRYDVYAAEKDRLKKAAAKKAQQSNSIKSPPKRMGNSEARLHKKMGGQSAREKLDRAAKAAISRMEQLEKVPKPWKDKPIAFDIAARAIHSAVLVNVCEVSKTFGERQVLDRCSFFVPNSKKTALIGPNGAGKTTLLDMIAAREPGIAACAGLKTGYYRQDAGSLDLSQSVLQNAMQSAVYDECFVRTILSRMLFRRDEMHKKAGLLSGGERLKLAIAAIVLNDFSLLVLDEPTNHLDMDSRGALEEVLAAYPGAVLFVSHDRAFIRAVADRIVCIRDERAQTFEGGWADYIAATAPSAGILRG